MKSRILSRGRHRTEAFPRYKLHGAFWFNRNESPDLGYSKSTKIHTFGHIYLHQMEEEQYNMAYDTLGTGPFRVQKSTSTDVFSTVISD